jgi:Tfp pilus assembly protein PilN
MIELFDANRLLPQRDRSLLLAGGVLGVGVVGLAAHAVYLEQQITHAQAEGRGAASELTRLKAVAPPPGAALLADLEQQALRLEADLAAAGGNPGGANGANPKASQWLERLETLASAEIGLSRVEIDRSGSARVEGMARSPQAVSSYVQAWERQQEEAPMRARAIEVRQDEKSAPLLHFQLRANLPGPQP